MVWTYNNEAIKGWLLKIFEFKSVVNTFGYLVKSMYAHTHDITIFLADIFVVLIENLKINFAFYGSSKHQLGVNVSFSFKRFFLRPFVRTTNGYNICSSFNSIYAVVLGKCLKMFTFCLWLNENISFALKPVNKTIMLRRRDKEKERKWYRRHV